MFIHLLAMLVLVWCVGAVDLPAAPPVTEAAAKTDGYHRWAIVASESLQEAGFADLLTAELSKETGLALVERQELERVFKEQELSAIFASQAAKERLQLGQLLKADALLLLSIEERDKRKFLKLVVSDCRYGARLRFEYLPYDGEHLETLCRECAAIVRETRQRFAAGIKHLIGVTQLLSKNLVHDYDHLQAGSAALLSHALSQFPGVAVLEIEEARAIARELGLTAGELEKRAVPLFVEGEFQMTAAKPDAEPSVRLVVRVSAKQETRTLLDREGLSPAGVNHALIEELPKRLLDLSRDRADVKFTAPDQRRILLARAEAFSRVGAWEHSTALREAALLLESTDIADRLALVGDYRRWLQDHHKEQVRLQTQSFRQTAQGLPKPQEAIWLSAQETRLARFRIMAVHIEWLLRTKALNLREADLVVSTVLRDGGMQVLAAETSIAGNAKETLDEAFWRWYPLFPALDPRLRNGAVGQAVQDCLQVRYQDVDRSSPSRQQLDWPRFALTFVTFISPQIPAGTSSAKTYDDRRTLDDLFRLLTEVFPRTVPLPCVCTLLLKTPTWPFDLNSMIAAGRLTVDEVRDFYLRLLATKESLPVFYARLGLLSLKTYAAPGQTLEAEAEKELDELLKSVRELASDDPEHRIIVAEYDVRLKRLRADIAVRIGKSGKKRHQLPKNPIPPVTLTSRIAFQPVDGLPVDFHALQKCTDSLDLMWSLRAVSVRSKPGVVRKIFEIDPGKHPYIPEEQIQSVAWDGESIWIACMKSGIHVVSPEGEPLGRAGPEQGLPPYEAASLPLHARGDRFHLHPRSIRLHPVGPNRCIAIGRYGKDRRLWFALLTGKNDDEGQFRYAANVFHTATELGPDAEDPTRRIFEIQWMMEYPEAPHKGPRWLLLGTGFPNGSRSTAPPRPLAIELKSLAVSEFPSSFRLPSYGSIPRFAVGKHVVAICQPGLFVFPPLKNDLSSDPEPIPLLRSETLDAPLRVRLLRWRGSLYNPGANWLQIDLENRRVERLTATPLPLRYRFEQYAVSAHFGLVAWNAGDQLYQVAIDQGQVEADDLASTYPFVPASQREQHHRAVTEIRRLGGSVDVRYGPALHLARPDSPQWRSVVYLSADWSGGESGLVHLKDLYNLSDLYLVGAEVGNDGLSIVGQLEGLESLSLVETRATDAGLAHLQKLRNLVYCRLEGTAGGAEFSDAGLEHLRGLPRLQKLTLYGTTVTDKTVAHLKLMPWLRELWLVDTSLTGQGLQELKGSKKGLFVYENEIHRLPE